jgi:hypothetical protein
MDHGHAHPSHDPSPLNFANNDPDRQQTPARPLAFLGVSNSSSPLRRSPQTTFETPLSLPQRRLQLRNAGFRAPRLPSHRLSTRISRWFSDRDEQNGQRRKSPTHNRENSPPTIRRRDTRGRQTHSSILEEITNSTRSRQPEQSAFIPVYEDDQDDSPAHSWYHDAPSTQQSPVACNPVHNKAGEMKLREISGNAQRSPPPLSSPLTRQVRGRSKRDITLGKTSFSASEHILFLETRLEESEKSQYSPNTGLPLKDKVKALTAENNRLQDMLAELEHQFETRLRDSVDHKTALEMNLKRQIKRLEEEIDSKDCTIRDLEYRNDVSQRHLSSVESWKAAVERLEFEKQGLEESNRSLEKRNDVLTEVLGQSPTRSHHGFEFPSPVRELQKRTPRPRSMMPRIQSPQGRCESNRPLSLHTSPSPFQQDYFSPLSALIREHDNPCNQTDVEPQKGCDDLQSIDSGLGESCSVRSGHEPASKRSSMYSYASASPAAWGLPFPPSPTDDVTRKSSRRRKTRRFASGSTQLKPLVLATLNPTSSFPQSAPLTSMCSDLERGTISECSFDPTTSFLSRADETLTQPMRRSDIWAAEDALKALEGTSGAHVDDGQVMDGREISQSVSRSALTFQEMREYSDFPSDPNIAPARSVDEVISEEGSSSFLSNQVEDAGSESFSSLAGEVSINESDVDRVSAGQQIFTTQFLESELPRPISLQLPTSLEPRYPMATGSCPVKGPGDADSAQGECSEVEAVPQPEFASAIYVEQAMPNPLVAPFPWSHPSLQQSGTIQSQHLDELSDSISDKSVQVPFCTGTGIPPADVVMPNPLRAAPPHCHHKSPKRAHSPLQLLQRKGSPTIPLASVSNRTIFGTISRYTSYVREIRRDPTALARRVIANAWCSNWKRFGMLSWWVLGLFLGPAWTQKVERSPGWEAYDGENIAQTEHERLNSSGLRSLKERHILHSNRSTPSLSRQGQQTTVKFVETNENRHEPQTEAQNARESKASWGRSLFLWGKFSVAILLAVGGAVIKGPGEMLKDCDLHDDGDSHSEYVRHKHDDTWEAEHHRTLAEYYSLHLPDDSQNKADERSNNRTSETASPSSHPSSSSSSSRTPTQSLPSKSILSTSHTPSKPPTIIAQKRSSSQLSSPDQPDHPDNNELTPETHCSHNDHTRVHQPFQEGNPPTAAPPPPLPHHPQYPHADLGTLQWMQQHLTVEDFEAPPPLVLTLRTERRWDGERTVRVRRRVWDSGGGGERAGERRGDRHGSGRVRAWSWDGW